MERTDRIEYRGKRRYRTEIFWGDGWLEADAPLTFHQAEELRAIHEAHRHPCRIVRITLDGRAEVVRS